MKAASARRVHTSGASASTVKEESTWEGGRGEAGWLPAGAAPSPQALRAEGFTGGSSGVRLRARSGQRGRRSRRR